MLTDSSASGGLHCAGLLGQQHSMKFSAMLHHPSLRDIHAVQNCRTVRSFKHTHSSVHGCRHTGMPADGVPYPGALGTGLSLQQHQPHNLVYNGQHLKRVQFAPTTYPATPIQAGLLIWQPDNKRTVTDGLACKSMLSTDI
jgi:hypothetical protein